MKKILFVSSSDLNLNNYTGDAVRGYNIINFLRKNNFVDTISFTSDKKKLLKKKIKTKRGVNFFFYQNNLLLKIFYCFKSLIKFKPIELGFFYSKQVDHLIRSIHKNYDTIIFHLARSAQYLPYNFRGTKILEMTDLRSLNYSQTKKHLNFYNPYFYLYFLERILIKKYEDYCFANFDKIVFVSKNDFQNYKKISKKIIFISNGINKNKKVYQFNKKNYKIIFIGNINYLPNLYACIDFAKNTLPKLNKKYPYIEFHIIGKINLLNKIKIMFNKNVKIFGQKKKLEKHIKNSICGLANMKIATGVQNKILTYNSFGLPALCSKKSMQGLSFLKEKDVMIFQNQSDLINNIKLLHENKFFSNKISKNSYSYIKKIDWTKVLKEYNKLI